MEIEGNFPVMFYCNMIREMSCPVLFNNIHCYFYLLYPKFNHGT